MAENPLDHGGKLDHNISLYGGLKSDWIDLSTGINKSSYLINIIVFNIIPNVHIKIYIIYIFKILYKYILYIIFS